MKITKIKFTTYDSGFYFHRGYLTKGFYIEFCIDLTKRHRDDTRILLKLIW